MWLSGEQLMGQSCSAASMENPTYTPEYHMHGFPFQSDTVRCGGQDTAASRKIFTSLQEQKSGWSHHLLSREAERMNRKWSQAMNPLTHIRWCTSNQFYLFMVAHLPQQFLLWTHRGRLTFKSQHILTWSQDSWFYQDVGCGFSRKYYLCHFT